MVLGAAWIRQIETCCVKSPKSIESPFDLKVEVKGRKVLWRARLHGLGAILNF